MEPLFILLLWLIHSFIHSNVMFSLFSLVKNLHIPLLRYDGWSDGSDESLGGPELELQSILLFIKEQQIANVIFISGDVHFPFCISYDPFEQGKPLFYEIGSTPFHALCLPPPEKGPDKSFNPTTLFVDGKFADQSFLNFGHVKIDEDANFTFNLRDVKGRSMFELQLKPTEVATGT
jgi:alkaline phosphatase D